MQSVRPKPQLIPVGVLVTLPPVRFKLVTVIATPGMILKLCFTCCAGLKKSEPAWSAATSHLPTATPVTVLPLVPLVVQIPTVVELNMTGLPEPPPVAVTVPVPPTKMLGLGTGPKTMVWLALKLAETAFAPLIITLQVDDDPEQSPVQPAKV